MAGNIYGYQGVHTPLESVTQGRYTLADYTTMRTELTSRLIALENQGGFIPTNVEITGYLHMLPGGAGLGEIETTSSITGASLYINGEMHGGNVVCDNDLACGGILSGNGSGLTNVTGSDATKLPLAGGTLTGALITQAVTVTGGYSISGNGSGLTNINDITKLPLAGGSISGSLAVIGTITGNGAGLTTIPYSALSGVVPTWNQSTTGNALTATTVTNLSGGSAGKIPYQSGVGTTLFSAVGTVGQVLTSQAAGAPTWTTPSSSPSYAYTYYTVNAVQPLNSLLLDNVIQVSTGVSKSFTFTGRVIGQRFTFIRGAIDPANATSLTCVGAGALLFRVFTIDGTQTNITSGATVAGLQYIYAGIQKIRNVFLVVASLDIAYSFDLIEIS